MNQGQQFLQYTLSGLTTGVIYAIVALGYVTVFNVTGVINFMQGELAMLGALLTVSLMAWGVNGVVAALAAVIVTACVGAAVETVTIRPAGKAGAHGLILITLAWSLIIRGLAPLFWGTRSYKLALFPDLGEALNIGGAVLPRETGWILAITVAVMALLMIFFYRSFPGLAWRASASNALAARLMGIKPRTMSTLVFALSGALGAVAGIVVTPLTLASFDMGFALGLKGFVAAALGGLTRVHGALLGGVLLGVFEALGGGLVATGYKNAIAYVVLILVLLVKPEGLTGRKIRDKV